MTSATGNVLASGTISGSAGFSTLSRPPQAVTLLGTFSRAPAWPSELTLVLTRLAFGSTPARSHCAIAQEGDLLAGAGNRSVPSKMLASSENRARRYSEIRAVLGGYSRAKGDGRRKGFTLLEVLLAMAVIVIGLTAVMGVNVTAVEALRRSEDNVVAAGFLEGEMVQIHLQSAAELGLKAGQWAGEWDDFPGGQWTIDATEESETVTALTSSAQWERSGHARSLSLTSKTASPPSEQP